MDTNLNDYVLLAIFEYANLNDLANLRLCSKRFKRLADSIKVTDKLVIYDRLKPIAGKLKYINEDYSLCQTVEVNDMDKFFKNETILNQLKKLKKLVIISRTSKPFDLNVQFDLLVYLELQDTLITTPTILKSPNIKYYHNSYAYFKNKDERDARTKLMQAGRAPPNTLGLMTYQVDQMRFKEIKYLNIRGFVEHEMLRNLIDGGFMKEVEEIHLFIRDFITVPYIWENCPRLKLLNLAVMELMLEIPQSMTIEETANRLERSKRENLTVLIFGLPLKVSTASLIPKFLLEMCENDRCNENPNSGYIRSWFELILTNSTYNSVIKKYEKQLDLDGYYKSIGLLHLGTSNVFINENFMSKLTNLETLCFSLFESPDKEFKKIFNSINPQLKSIWFRSRDASVKHNNELFQLVTKKCPNLIHLSIDNRLTKNLNLSFIYQLERLTFLKLNLGYVVDERFYLNVVRKMKYLDLFDVRFIASSDQSKDELSNFKKKVNDVLINELNKKDYEFKITIHKRKPIEKFTRFVMKRKDRVDHLDKEYEEVKLYQWSVLMLCNLGQNQFMKLHHKIWTIDIMSHFQNYYNY